MSRKGLKKLGTILETLQSSKRNLLVDAFDSRLLIKQWPFVVGEKLAQVTLPLKDRRKTLLILSSHAIYSQELKFMEMAILDKIFSLLPKFKRKIQRMSFQTNESLFEEKKKQFSHVIEKKEKDSCTIHPQSPEYKIYKKEAENISLNIDDRELRDLVISLYIKVKAEEKRSLQPKG